MQSILIVEDDEALGDRLVRAMQARGLVASVARSGKKAIELANIESPELAVVDLRLPDMTGIEVLQTLKAIDPMTRVVMLTGYGSIANALEAVRLGATHYLTKPAHADEILTALAREQDEPFESTEAEVPSLAQAEWDHIQRILQDCEGNISKAARALGMHRRSLQRKLQKRPS